MNRFPFRLLVLTLAVSLLPVGESLFAWGLEGHRIVNLNGIRTLPISMQRFRDIDYYFADHASDVDRSTSLRPEDHG